jgi:hypothetical protein
VVGVKYSRKLVRFRMSSLASADFEWLGADGWVRTAHWGTVHFVPDVSLEELGER